MNSSESKAPSTTKCSSGISKIKCSVAKLNSNYTFVLTNSDSTNDIIISSS